MIFSHFYSDPHFGHANIIECCRRPFKDVREMSRELIARYNAAVKPDDTVLWLGDCFWHPNRPYAKEIMQTLNGRKWLVKGNHDRGATKMMGLGFEVVVDEMYVEFPETDENVIATHKPINDPIRGFNLHGHTHSTKRFGPYTLGIHCGVDAWDYAPVPRSAVKAIMRGLTG
jgi:calcineurin-like phosphoesterase family protein